MVYDCFTFFNELDLLEIRLNTLDAVVDKFVIAEATGVFTADYRARHFLPTLSTVSTAVRRLVDTLQIDSFDGVYRIIDPIFAHHLRRGIMRESK
jgi:beta-1,4-mannosyl-glycoprotein beta-1,4-N-acetylglucosaminyltransferase